MKIKLVERTLENETDIIVDLADGLDLKFLQQVLKDHGIPYPVKVENGNAVLTVPSDSAKSVQNTLVSYFDAKNDEEGRPGVSRNPFDDRRSLRRFESLIEDLLNGGSAKTLINAGIKVRPNRK